MNRSDIWAKHDSYPICTRKWHQWYACALGHLEILWRLKEAKKKKRASFSRISLREILRKFLLRDVDAHFPKSFFDNTLSRDFKQKRKNSVFFLIQNRKIKDYQESTG